MLMLDLADSSIRAYKKGNGNISLHLRSYLLVRTNATFSLSHYMKNIDCKLILLDRTEIDFDYISYSVAIICEYAFQTMAHNFQASTITNLTNIEQSLGVLKVNYHISFTGHLFEKSRSFEKIVPIIKRY
ncbi:MAG: hypothetical protein WAU61_11680 [Smithella sp.]